MMMDLRRRALMGAQKKKMPYLIATGKQYINTGFVPDRNTKLVVEMTLTKKGTSMHGVIDNGTYFTMGTNAYTWMQGGYGSAELYRTQEVNLAKHLWTIEYRTIYCDNLVVYRPSVEQANAINNMTLPIYLFAVNNNGTPSSLCNIKFYSASIYQSGVLTKRYSPKIIDGVGQVFEEFSGTIVPNLGTSAFGYGEEDPK